MPLAPELLFAVLVCALAGTPDVRDDGREPATRLTGGRIGGRVELDSPLPAEIVVEATVYLREAVEILRTGVEADGSFAFELPEGAVWGTLDLECPLLELEGEVVFEPGWTSLRLRPRLLAIVQGRAHVPPRSWPEPEAERRIECGPVGMWGSGTDLPPFPVMRAGVLHADGSFRIEGLPSGVPLNLCARIGRAQAVAEVWPLAPGELRTQELTLRFPGTLRGTVADEHGQPVENAWISLYTPEERQQQRTTTDADGRFEIVDVSPGHWAVEARAVGLDLARQELELAEHEEHELRFTLGRPAIVRGEVRRPDGSPYVHAAVCEVDFARRRFPDFHSILERPCSLTDRSGRFELRVHTGRVQIAAGVDGWAPSAPLTLELEPGSTSEGIVLVLRARARLRGGLLDPLGLPAPPTALSLTYPDGTVYEFSSNGFAQFDLPAGVARITTLSWPDVWGASAEVELWPHETAEVALRLRYR